MAQALQSDLFQNVPELKARRISHGGELAKGRRKTIRPLDRKKPVHLILKSSHAKGRLSFLSAKNRLQVNEIIRSKAKRFGIKIHKFENVGNHLHFNAVRLTA